MSLSFRYRAATPAGEVVEGVVQADTPRGAMDELRRQTLVPVDVAPIASDGSGSATLPHWLDRRRRDAALATAARTLASMLAGGATLDRALRFAADHALSTEVGSALSAVRNDVQRGETLANALRAHQDVFGSLAPAVVRAGEESGTLDQSLARYADHVERARDLRAQLRATLLYPALMGVVAGVGIVVLLTFVVPRFVAILNDTGGTLPLSTRLLMATSAAAVRWWWAWLALGAVVLVGGRAWLAAAANRERWHAARLALPVVGTLERAVATARFSRTFGTLLQGGAPLLTALRVGREAVDNLALGAALERSERAVARGEPVAGSLGPALPPLATQLFAVGEESGSLDVMALRVADTFDAESQRTLRSLVALIEPLLIVAFGAMVGFVALAMLQAIYSINASAL
ncbi:MAG: type II secretion system F family protein [Gemmatimonadaceae bacterium]|nr:type II secretion system F family protein [Gemmatimonadaceae bacterium]